MVAEVKVRLFNGVPPDELKTIVRLGTERQVPSGRVICEQGAQAHEFFLLVKGRARYFINTHDGRKVNLAWLVPGEIFGARALLAPLSSYLVSTEALRDSTVIVWKRDLIRELAARSPALAFNALSVASDYLEWYVATHLALVSETARERVARVLARLAPTIGREVDGGIEIDVTNEKLASAANVTPFTASRLLNEWQRDRAVLKRRGKVVLKSPEKLFLRTA